MGEGGKEEENGRRQKRKKRKQRKKVKEMGDKKCKQYICIHTEENWKLIC